MTAPLRIGEPVAMDSTERRWAERAADLEIRALPDVRGLAEKWAASLTAVLGVVGLAALIEGADTFDKLDDPWKAVAQWSFVVAAVLALIATALAIAAAQGTAKRTFVPGGSALRDYAEKSVDDALGLLAASRWLAVVAASGVLVAAGCLWFGDEAKGGATIVEIQGSQLCGAASRPAAATGDADIVVRCAR